MLQRTAIRHNSRNCLQTCPKELPSDMKVSKSKIGQKRLFNKKNCMNSSHSEIPVTMPIVSYKLSPLRQLRDLDRLDFGGLGVKCRSRWHPDLLDIGKIAYSTRVNTYFTRKWNIIDLKKYLFNTCFNMAFYILSIYIIYIYIYICAKHVILYHI